MEKRKSSGKSHLKDLCSEDKAKVGELIQKIAHEKKSKMTLKNEISELKQIIEKLTNEKLQVLMEKERAVVKLDKCMDLLKNLQVKPSPEKVDVYCQTFNSDDNRTILTSEIVESCYDDKFFTLVENIENEGESLSDPLLMKIIEEIEFSS